ncbi:MAG: UDP-N-acetylglucosamine 2-epimerase (non-hydrolyzing) [Victivallales bacterium]
MKIINVVGARPNFMKIAPLMEAYKAYPEIEPVLVHTGQHYDDKMSDMFFRELGIAEPDVNLGVGSASNTVQTAEIMKAFAEVCMKFRPDAVLVVGDVNSTMACSIVAKQLGIRLIHYEAGIRSFDRDMPEEINRLVTDSIADCFLVTEQSAIDNLKNEGQKEDKIHFVGNLMIDTLMANQDRAEQKKTYRGYNLSRNNYALLTMHRPSNVDHPATLKKLVDAFEQVSSWIPIIYPVHPRTEKNLRQFDLWQRFSSMKNIILTGPAGYLDMLNLQMNCRFIMTDSGGMQEESSVLNKPCITLRSATERPVTVSIGSSVLAGNSPVKLLEYAEMIRNNAFKKAGRIPLWDGNAARRIVERLGELPCGRQGEK